MPNRLLAAVCSTALAAPALAQAVRTSADAYLVTARGSKHPRSLEDRFAEVANVKDFGARGDGSADDTAAIRSAYAALTPGGGTLVFPPGTYKFNLLIDRSGIIVQGGGAGNVNTGLAATKLVAANPAMPLLQVGDGKALVRGIRISDMELVGDGASPGGDGLLVLGAADVWITNVVIDGFGRDNISITSGTDPKNGITFAVNFLNVNSANARGSGFKATFGPQWVTAINLANCKINGYLAPATAMVLDGVQVNAVNTYVDVPGNLSGHVVLRKTTGVAPRIVANGLNIDNSGGANAIAVDVMAGAGSSVPTNFLWGSVHLNGRMRLPSGSTFAGGGGPAGTGTSFISSQTHVYAAVPYFIYFPDQSAPSAWDGATNPPVRLFRADHGAPHGKLRLEGADLLTTGALFPGTTSGLIQGSVGIYTGTSPPRTGTFTAGSRVINSAPAVGKPKGWICTVGGSPGTWVSEGNL